MSLRFFLGAAGAGKTRACLDEICDELARDPLFGEPLYFLVPEQATFQMERALLSHRPEISAAARARVVSFKRLAALVLQEDGRAARPLMGEMGKLLALQAVVARTRDRLRLFGSISTTEGFLEELSSTISELRAYRQTPAGLSAVAELLKDEGVIAEKAYDLALLYTEYDAFVRERFDDPETALDAACGALARSRLMRGARVWIDGFAGFTPQEYAMLEALLVVCRRVTVALCLDPYELGGEIDSWSAGEPGELFHPTRESLVAIRDLARSLGIPIEPPRLFAGAVRPRFRSAPLLGELQRLVERGWRPSRRLGAVRGGLGAARETAGTEIHKETLPAVEVVEAPDPRAEVEAVAREVMRLVREHGMRFGEIAVITRDLEPYRELVEECFARWRIPYFLDHKDAAHHHPVVVMIRTSLEIAAHGFETERVIRYLKTDLAPVSRDEVDLLENEALRLGVQGEAWRRLEPWPERGFASRPRHGVSGEEVARIRRTATEPLLDFARGVYALTRGDGDGDAPARVPVAPLREYLKLLRTLLAANGVAETVASWIDRAVAGDQPLLAQEHAQVWEGVTRLLEQLDLVLGEFETTPHEFCEVVTSGLRRLTIGRVPPRIDQVLVGSVERSRQPDLRAAIILGANDGLFPKTPREDALFLDEERALLETVGVQLGPGSRARLLHEDYLVYIALTRASERLLITYSRADESGRPRRPSLFVERVLATCLGVVKTVLPAAGLPEPWPERKGGLVPWLCRHLARIKEGAPQGAPRERLIAAYHWLLAHPQAGLLSRSRAARGPRADPLEALAHRRREAPLTRRLVDALYGDPVALSPSGLETFAACPFSFFAQFGLGLEERAAYRLGAAELGQVSHAVLSRFVQELKERQLDWGALTRDESDAMVQRIAGECVAEMAGDPGAARRADAFAIERLVRGVQAVAWALGEHARRGAFRPAAVELSFGTRGALPPLVLPLEDGRRAIVRGRIDRIDVAESSGKRYVRIIDYKSSRHGFRLDGLVHGLDLQLALYLAALYRAASGELGPVEPAGCLYQPVFDPLVSVDAPSEAGEAGWRKELKADGLILDDGVVPRLMDGEVQGASELVPLHFNKDGGLGKRSKVADPGRMSAFLEFALRRAGELAAAIARGEAGASPYELSETRPCAYCAYKPVCQFDATVPGDAYRSLTPYRDPDAWDRITGGGEAPGEERAG